MHEVWNPRTGRNQLVRATSPAKLPASPSGTSSTIWRLAIIIAIWLGFLIWPSPQLGSFISNQGLQTANSTITNITHWASTTQITLPQVHTTAANPSPHQYWQAGVLGSDADAHDTGMRASIVTRVPQQVASNTTNYYYWVGAYLADESFVQVGYFVPWYASTSAGWFYCAFSADGKQGPCRYGPAGSAGNNGTTHQYTLQALTDGSGGVTWQALMDGTLLGSFAWSTANTGSHAPSIYAESSGYAPHLADSTLGPVDFPGGMQELPAGTTNWVHVAHASAVYSSSDVCSAYGIASDQHGGILLGSGLNCPAAGSQIW